MITTVPAEIKKVFRLSSEPVSPEERLWRERAARMTLDALGYTNLTVKPLEHNETVRYARRWFRQLFVDHPDPKQADDAEGTFESGGIAFCRVKRAVLGTDPILFEEPEIEDE
jgi:hypothetical protein